MKLFFSILMLCSIQSFSFAQISYKELAGKWQEESREFKKDNAVTFQDTMRLEIRPEGFVMVRYNVGPTFFGEATIKGKYLTIKENDFEIHEISPENLTLIDEKGIHYFKKVVEFNSTPVVKLLPGKEEGEKNITIQTLKGKWTCYKKTDPKFSKSNFYLKSINFIEDKGNGTYVGSTAFSSMDSIYSIEAFIYVKDKTLLISTDEETFKANVLKSNGEELILENGTITYFLKQFGKKD